MNCFRTSSRDNCINSPRKSVKNSFIFFLILRSRRDKGFLRIFSNNFFESFTKNSFQNSLKCCITDFKKRNPRRIYSDSLQGLFWNFFQGFLLTFYLGFTQYFIHGLFLKLLHRILQKFVQRFF